MYATDFFEVRRQRFVQIETGMRVQEDDGNVADYGLGVPLVFAEILAAHRRGHRVHVLEIRVNGNVIDGVPEPLGERLRFRVRRVQRRYVRRVGRAVERVLVPGEHLTGHEAHVRYAQLAGQVRVAPGAQQLGDHQVVGACAQRLLQVRVAERRATRVLLAAV